jgi:hypothetical protein
VAERPVLEGEGGEGMVRYSSSWYASAVRGCFGLNSLCFYALIKSFLSFLKVVGAVNKRGNVSLAGFSWTVLKSKNLSIL